MLGILAPAVADLLVWSPIGKVFLSVEDQIHE